MEERLDFEALLRENRDYQSACDRKVSQALATARANWERDRQGEEDRLRSELEGELERRLAEERSGLAQRQQAFEARLRQVAVAQSLQQRGLDACFAPWIAGESEEEDRQRVEEFTRLFQTALSQAIAGRMRGEEPPREPEKGRELDRDRLRTMSAAEINRNWGDVSALLRGTER
ncbi:MAG: DUF4355 domain-containing protein [Oscillospiraceae bacterium]|nr:DUF4355 domain-containing protein [Oscillospiraceae bacterium]